MPSPEDHIQKMRWLCQLLTPKGANDLPTLISLKEGNEYLGPISQITLKLLRIRETTFSPEKKNVHMGCKTVHVIVKNLNNMSSPFKMEKNHLI